MFFNELLNFYKGPDCYIWYGAVADINNDKWTFQKLSSANIPDMDKWVKKVASDISLSCTNLKNEAIASCLSYKPLNTFSKTDVEKIYYAALKLDENRIRKLVKKTKSEIKKWIRSYVGDEKKEASVARYLEKL